jgi:hypothetical protein
MSCHFKLFIFCEDIVFDSNFTINLSFNFTFLIKHFRINYSFIISKQNYIRFIKLKLF